MTVNHVNISSARVLTFVATIDYDSIFTTNIKFTALNCPSLSDNVIILFFLLSGLECGSIKDLSSEEEVVKALKTPLASMQYGMEDFLAKLVAQACSEFIPLLSASLMFTRRERERERERERKGGGRERLRLDQPCLDFWLFF